MRQVVTQPNESESKPLTEPVLLILMSLANKPRHGYALMKDIERLSNGRVRLSTGTLYGALRRLLADHWIERFELEAWKDPQHTIREGNRRTLCRLLRKQGRGAEDPARGAQSGDELLAVCVEADFFHDSRLDPICLASHLALFV